MGDWNPTKEELKLHEIFDSLRDFAEELKIDTMLIDTLFNTFYSALEAQGKMSEMVITEEERLRVMADVWAKMVERGMVDMSKIPEA